MKKIFFALLLAHLVNPTIAQQKKFTIAEATNGLATTLAPKGIRQPMWQPGTHTFYYKGDDGYTTVDLDKPERSGLAIFGGRTLEKSDVPQWLRGGRFYYQRGNTITAAPYLTRISDNNFTIEEGAEHISMHESGNLVAYTVGNNLYAATPGSSVIKITDDKNEDIVNGQAVHRNEFGIEEGIFISPDANYIAYYRMDQTMVKDYPIIDWSKTPAEVKNIKYPMAGGTSHEVTLCVYNIATGDKTTLQTGTPADQYLTSVTWSPDERYIYVGLLNRGQNHLRLNQYNARTGILVKTLLEEKHRKYVEPQHPLTFLPENNNEFIYWSQRDGYMHLWLCNIANDEMRCLTPGRYDVNELLGFNTTAGEVLFTAAKEDPREKHGYALNWKTGKMRRLDTEPGTHNMIASTDGKFVFDSYSGKGIAKMSVIRSTASGEIIKTLAESKNPLNAYDRPNVKDVTLEATDGTPLYGKLILPVDFDPAKKYKTIVYLYNGPHVQLVKNAFPESGNLWYEYMAQKGYIVWTMDGRGSSNRGLDFENAIHGRLGDVEMEDQMTGVNYLKSLPYVDADRMGIHGWSFGGFMTTSFMLRHPGLFKVGVAGGPVMDWRMYEIMYTERYMDTPQENPEGYAANNLLTKAKNLKGDLLLIHGTDDNVVVWQHTINFLRECIKEGVQADYFVYPGHEHNVRGKDRVHLMQKITDYFDEHL